MVIREAQTCEILQRVGIETRLVDAPASWKEVFASLRSDSDPEVQRLTRRLAIHFRDLQALRRSSLS